MTVSAIVDSADGLARYDNPRAARAAPGTTWVRATEATDEELDRVAAAFDLHPLTVEDLDVGIQPKTEGFQGYTFVLFKTAELTTEETSFTDEIRAEPVGLFIGDDWLVTLSRAPSRPTDRVWRAVANGDGRGLGRGTDFLACRVIDTIVEEYYEVLNDLEDGIETVEEAVVAAPDSETIETINDVRRDLLSFRKLVWPSRSAVGALVRGDSPQVRERTEKYYRDVYDHLAQLVDLIETYRDLIRGARDVYQNTLSQSANEVMKTLTVVATIVFPLTLVTGIYGMNFRVMPELEWAYGYPAVLLGMGAIATILVVSFKRQGYF